MEQKKYWKSIEEYRQDPEFIALAENEFAEELPVTAAFHESVVNAPSKRRDFLKMLGFSVSAATIAASCEIPIKKVIPYVVKPEDIVPGVASWYASTYAQGGDYCSILVKTREGRPIKIEGNDKSDITHGATSARVQGSVLSLYDNTRRHFPRLGESNATWDQVDKEIMGKLDAIRAKEGKIAIVSSTIMSPSTKKAIREFQAAYPGTKHVQYDAIAYDGMLNANEWSFGKRAIPSYRFDKAKVIVSLGADFLGTWISPIEFTHQYSKNRKLEKENASMSRHFQIETGMSLTGTNADRRATVKPSNMGLVALNLHNKVAGLLGKEQLSGVSSFDLAANMIEDAAAELKNAAGNCLVVCGSNDPNIQMVVNAINQMLGNYGSTIDMDKTNNFKQGSSAGIAHLTEAMNAGKVDAVIVYDANPVYDTPMGGSFAAGLAKVETTISFNSKDDETGSACKYSCPDHHYLEAWNDAEPKTNSFSLAQPTIHPLFDTRAAQESLLKWSGNNTNYYDYIKANWKETVFANQSKYSSFANFWDHSLHNGVATVGSVASAPVADDAAPADDVAEDAPPAEEAAMNVASAAAKIKAGGEGMEIHLYEKIGMGDGRYANNPWLQEMPDPVTKVTWDNYAAISSKLAQEKGVLDGDLVSVSAGDTKMTLPVLIQPGQAYGTVSVALGYGRTMAGVAGDGVGLNANSFVAMNQGTASYSATVEINKVEGRHELASTQWHHNINPDERPIVRETTLDEYKADPTAGNKYQPMQSDAFVTLYDEHDYSQGHHWAMVIDLNACTGCGNCIVACQAENNVPVVGREEVLRRHEMHWMRIDRYYVTEQPDSYYIQATGDTVYAPEEEMANPQVLHQPLICQHCDNAPCENVCPVAATNHSSEGINQMAYNRCVGTRYCANNCPFKVRRFNWYDYTDADAFGGNEVILPGSPNADDMSRMVLNPDVTVRSRGVMEKCTFCVQRIQGAKLDAKKDGRALVDGDIKTACQQSCPAGAIVFGDLNDENSEVAKLYKNERKYHALEEIHVLPSIGYLTKVRNNTKEEVKTKS
jgi:molybdopterin-containing oxidoreductase family iron-sulfur binding subunit